jgi:O-antigen/teichoic acid export membrane protein
MQRRAGIGRLAAGTAGYRVAALPIAFVTSVVTSRFLLPTGRGAFTLAILTVTLVASLLRTGAAVTHFVPRSTSDDARETVLRAIGTSCAVGTVGAVALIPVNEAIIPHAPAILALGPLVLPAMLITDALNGFLVAKGRVEVANRIQFLNPALTLGAMAVLVVGLGLGLRGAMISWMVSQCIPTIVALAVCLEVLRETRVVREPWQFWDRRGRAIAWFAVRSGMAGAISLINYRIDLFLLRGFHGVRDIGIYSLAVSLAELAWILPQSLAVASTPAIVNYDSDREAASLTARVCRFALALSFISAAVIGGGSILFLPEIFGRAFAPSTGPLIVLLPGVIAFAPASSLATFFALRKGKVALTALLALISALATAIVGVAVIPALASIGAAAASAAGYVVGGCTAVAVFARMTGVPIAEFLPRPRDYTYVRSIVTRRGLISY